jgi:peptidoglycan/xylan/chitin deacetylase (PgdA/CDA1 family)
MDRPTTPPIRRFARRVKSLLGSRVVILLYHRIGPPGCDPHRLCVTPAHFAEQMDALREFGPVLPLADVARHLQAGRLPRRASAITFDDGYADNLENAKPILQARGLPATVFATTGEIGRTREFWWDELERLLLHPGTLPSRLGLTIDGATYDWNVIPDYTPADAAANAAWDFERPGGGEPPGSRQWLYRQVYHRLWDLTDGSRQAVLDQLLRWSGQPAVVRPAYRAMSDRELLDLDAGGLIEVGAHTHTHPNLAAQSADVQRDEIVRSQARLQNVLGRPVESFAYPFGLHTPETVRLLRDAGFSRACACMGHSVRSTSEPLRLTRIDLGDCDGDDFARLLRESVAW